MRLVLALSGLSWIGFSCSTTVIPDNAHNTNATDGVDDDTNSNTSDDPVDEDNTNESGDPEDGDNANSGEDPDEPGNDNGTDDPDDPDEPSADALADFAAPDVNPASARYEQDVSPRDYLGQVSAWYFGHATWGYCRSQFGFLDQLQTEINTGDTPLEIHILGLNDAGYESGNDGMVAGQSLPWLQPAAGDNIWALWEVTYRDVFIVGAANELLDVFNLTENDLSNPDNYDTLMNLLLDAAVGGSE